MNRRQKTRMVGILGACSVLLAGCGGGGTPSGDFSLGGGNGGTGGGTSALSGFVLTATARSAANALTWTVPTMTGTATGATTAVTYDIARTAGTSGAAAVLVTGFGGSQYSDTNVTAGTTYRYQVTAHFAGLASSSNPDSATVGGPTSVGVGDPATGAAPTGSLYTGAAVRYVTQPGGSRLTLDLTLSHTASTSDLRTLQVAGNIYIPTTGVTVSGSHLLLDSLAAGIPVPALAAGRYVSITATVVNTTSGPVVPNAGRLELTGLAPQAGVTRTDGPSGFQITLQNTP